MFADKDGRGNRSKRRRYDIEFLEELRTARDSQDMATLNRLVANHAHKKAPDWRKMAINRAFTMLGLPEPLEIENPEFRARWGLGSRCKR